MSNQVFEPNQFVLQDNETQIQYLSSNRVGVPELDYQTTQCNGSDHFSGDEISLVATAIGRIITVTLASNCDQRSERMLTLLLPTVYLPVDVIEHLIQAEVIFTTQRVPQRKGWRRVEGQVETYETRTFNGIARLVEF